MSDPSPQFDPSEIDGERGELDVADFADLFGTSVDGIPADLQEAIAQHDFGYVILQEEDRERVLLEVLQRIDSGAFSLAGAAGKERWDVGWSENLDAFVASGFDLGALIPKYIRPRQPVRLYQNYVLPTNSAFELDWYEIFRPWFLQTYFEPYDAVFEFGCGSGFNLAALAQINPHRRYVGLDWAEASAKIVDAMGSHFGWRMEGRTFDFFHPDASLEVPPNSAFLTIGALEQTGENWTAFLDFVMDKRPACVFHVEPILEWYDDRNPVDHAAVRFHEQRKYWRGFPKKLAELEKAGKIEILKRKRSFFGSLYIEGYSQFIWRPRN